ncbi:DNA-binding protein [Pseudomonas parafulva]|uniref:DNA-binding protein n=1 Tax=Pseudomonas parafulva TaxID=157782 RepID=UPI000540D795|nr:DNA-binding protein [Pseudomonas parafulva]AIZ32881.1 Tn4652, cointegrate resolution protein T [Pseudomonas parafulva]
MARGGINKAVVQRARQALIARGEHPSIDAVRIELGNTGSKTTIHRYLKELDAQLPVQSAPALGETLGRYVQQLADQLNEEAEARVALAQAAFDAQIEQMRTQLSLAEQALVAADQQQQIQASALQSQSERLETTLASLQSEQLRSASLNQSLGELQVRLDDKIEQIRSLEDKHRNARDALEHYRSASREQRELDQRRHEAQVQQLQVELRQMQQGMVVRQEELTRLHRDNERLSVENRQQQAQRKQLDEQLEQRDAQVQGLRSILAQAQGASEELRRQWDNDRQALESQRELTLEQARLVERLQDRLTLSEARSAQLALAAEEREKQINQTSPP